MILTNIGMLFFQLKSLNFFRRIVFFRRVYMSEIQPENPQISPPNFSSPMKNESLEAEDFVVVSKVKTGLKREFQFALKSQNEISNSIAQKRVRKTPSIHQFSAAKKKKKNSSILAKNKLAENEGVVEEDEHPQSDVVDDVISDDELSSKKLPHIVDSQRRENEEVSKVPTRLKELLQTGFLEGLFVKYIRGSKKVTSDGGLSGMIRGTGVVCFCEDCNGCQVVTPNQFELHAKSANKRPADYIYLENGKSLRDVLSECMNANLKSLKVTILNAISSTTEKNSAFCAECKEPIADVHVGRTMQRCISCSQVEASHTTPIQEGIDTDKRSIEALSVQKSSHDASNSSLQSTESLGNITRKSVEAVSLPKPSFDASNSSSQSTKSQGKITRKDLRLHKLVFQDDFLPDGTELGYYVQGQKLLSGYKQGSGIFCYCCNTEISPSQFEAHAGHASRRKPYLNIYTSNGASLHELSLTLSRTSQFSTDENDDLCTVCYGLGDLLCCDGCPRAFHLECISLSSIPENKWYCNYCEDMFQKEKFADRNPNAIAAGRIPGVDPVEQITNRCIRIVKTLESQDSGGCALCRVHDFCDSGFGPRTVIICDQCEKEYHIGCLKGHKMQFLKELPVGDWFCCPDCERINSTLKEAVEEGEKKLPDYLMGVVKQKLIEKDSGLVKLDVTWRVFNGRKSCLDEIRPLLAKAVSVFHEQFDPISYGQFKQDLIPHLVYGRNLKEKEFGGMYCAVINVNSTIVSCAVFRVFGKEVVEILLAATSKGCEGKGYFQCLYSCMERLFEELGVKNIVLPAAEETRSLWMNKFGFSLMPQDKLNDWRRCYALLNFAGTSVLHKLVPRT